MSYDWTKLGTDFYSHPKAVAAGRLGRELFPYLLCTNTRLDADGEIPLLWVSPGYVQHAVGQSEPELNDALAALEQAELIEVTDTHIRLSGWDDSWRPALTSTERTRRWRDKQAQRGTKRDDVGRSGTERDEGDAIRREEKRRDKKRDTPPTPPTRKRKKRNGVTQEVKNATAEVVDAFNRCMKRRLSPGGFEQSVARCMERGYSVAQLKAVVWWAGREWSEDDRFRTSIDPVTLLKFQSSSGSRTFPQYLALASEAWRESHDGEVPPWEK